MFFTPTRVPLPKRMVQIANLNQQESPLMEYSNHTLRTTLLFLVLIELLSFFGWLVPDFNTVVFFVVTLLVSIIAVVRLDIALFIALAELFIGSKGYLFFFDSGGTRISIRIALWIVIMGVWGGKLIIERFSVGSGLKPEPKHLVQITNLNQHMLLKWLVAFGAVLLWSFIWGLIRNDFNNVFFDFNNWLYWLYALPFLTVFKTREHLEKIKDIALASLSVIVTKTLLYTYIFSHGFVWAVKPLYRWVRESGVGEITLIGGNFYRVFFQSHVWVVIGFLVALGVVYHRHEHGRGVLQYAPTIALILFAAVILLSFSRSFWLGLAGALGFFLVMTLFREGFKKTIAWCGKLTMLAVAGFLIVLTISYFPPKGIPVPLSSLVEDRLTKIEAAGSSRINLLRPLFKKIIAHPLIGSGWGATITYTSADPRIVSQTPGQSGTYTTYAFEWGWLDLWLKTGLMGVFVYLGLCVVLLRALFSRITYNVLGIREKSGIAFGLYLGLISLMIIHIFTPYLNHPLGIGFIVLIIVWLNIPEVRDPLNT